MRRSLYSSKRFWATIIALLIAGSVIWHFTARSAHKTQRTVTVQTGTVEDVVTAQGILEPKNYVDVGLQVSGQIKKLHVDIGDTVKKGQLLAEIDPRIYQSKLDQDTALLHSLQAQVSEQKAALLLTQQQQRRNQKMIAGKAISQDTFEQGAAALAQAKAKLQALKAQVEQTNSTLRADRTNLEYTKVYSPMDGTVATLPVREGQTLNSVQSAPTLMRVADLKVMTDRVQVAEADVMRLKTGTSVYFTTLGEMEQKYTTTVRLIQPSPEVLNNVVLFDVLIDAENTDGRLMDGMNTQVFFVLGRAENTAILPVDALGARLQNKDNTTGKAYFVRVVGQEKPVVVYTGLSDRTHIEIRSGLKAGDKVILPERERPGRQSGMPPGMGGPKL